jgi:hypothetical protein
MHTLQAALHTSDNYLQLFTVIYSYLQLLRFALQHVLIDEVSMQQMMLCSVLATTPPVCLPSLDPYANAHTCALDVNKW